MIIGGCPYCGQGQMTSIATGDGGDGAGKFAKRDCDDCGKTYWLFFSRYLPKAWTLEEFGATYVVDEATHKIAKREPDRVEDWEREYKAANDAFVGAGLRYDKDWRR